MKPHAAIRNELNEMKKSQGMKVHRDSRENERYDRLKADREFHKEQLLGTIFDNDNWQGNIL